MQINVQSGLKAIKPFLSAKKSSDDSLFGGNLGLVLLYYEWYRQTGKTSLLHKGEKLLSGILNRINKGKPGIAGSSFSTGGAGLAFVISLLEEQELTDLGTHEALAELDQFLFDAAMYQLDHGLNDCLHGAFGIIHYFTRQHKARGSNIFLDELIAKACSIVVKEPQGYWFHNDMPGQPTTGVINFSLSHGLSGMLLILLEAYTRTIHKKRIEEVVRKGIQFIRKHQLYVDSLNGEYSFYPLLVNEQGSIIENRPRMAWCYGDLNEVLLFYRAANLFHDQQLKNIAEIVGMHSLMRKDEASTQVSDSHFCHGAAGLAQFYKCLHRESGNEKYLGGYRFWIGKTLEYIHRDIANGRFTNKEHSLLEGPVGVALVLLSYLSAEEKQWENMFFL